MKKIPNEIIETYRSGHYIVEICKEKDGTHETYGAYIRKVGFGVKEYMFGVDANEYSLDEFTDLVDANLPDYKEVYKGVV